MRRYDVPLGIPVLVNDCVVLTREARKNGGNVKPVIDKAYVRATNDTIETDSQYPLSRFLQDLVDSHGNATNAPEEFANEF